jgi:hypothetical protein
MISRGVMNPSRSISESAVRRKTGGLITKRCVGPAGARCADDQECGAAGHRAGSVATWLGMGLGLGCSGCRRCGRWRGGRQRCCCVRLRSVLPRTYPALDPPGACSTVITRTSLPGFSVRSLDMSPLMRHSRTNATSLVAHRLRRMAPPLTAISLILAPEVRPGAHPRARADTGRRTKEATMTEHPNPSPIPNHVATEPARWPAAPHS